MWAVRRGMERPLHPFPGLMKWIGVILLATISLKAGAEPAQVLRFEKPLEDLRSLFKSDDPKKVVDALVKSGRGRLFALEGLARLYRGQHPEPIGELKKEAKWLEDRVGRLVDLGEHVEYAKKVGAKRATIKYLEEERDKYREILAGKLEKKGWVGGEQSLVDRWTNQVRETKWETKEDDRQYVLQQLIDLTQELRKEEWDIRDLQNGLHDFRRRVRWMTIYLMALDGMAQFDGRPLENLTKILKDPVTKSPYANLAKNRREKFPILIPREVFLELIKAIERLGFAKDTGEATFEWLPEALLNSKMAKTETEAKELAATMVKKHPHFLPIFETGENTIAYLRAEDGDAEKKEARGILAALKHRLKKQIDWTQADCAKAMKGL